MSCRESAFSSKTFGGERRQEGCPLGPMSSKEHPGLRVPTETGPTALVAIQCRRDASFVTTSWLRVPAGPDVGVVRFDGDLLDRQYAEMIAESIPHIVWTASPDGATTYFNRQGTDYTGCPRETNYAWNWVTLVHPEDAERAAQAWQHATMTGTDYLQEYRIRRFDGVFRWHAFRAIPIRDAAGEIDVWIGTATDIEDQKQQELALRRAERDVRRTAFAWHRSLGHHPQCWIANQPS